jgi:ribosomal protein S18 acetylase RimI-like enzyme
MIRKAIEKDINGIMELLRQVNLVHHRGRPDLFNRITKYNEDELHEILGNTQRPILVAVDENDSLQGYAFCEIQEPHSALMVPHKTLYIDDLCVNENCRGQHIGTALYSAVKDFAHNMGCYNITLNVWSCNPSAISFYEKIGLKPYKIGMEEIL